MTISAHRIISDPSVIVIADRLVSSEILQLIQGECRIARKLPGCAEEAQDEVSALTTSLMSQYINKNTCIIPFFFFIDILMGQGRFGCWETCGTIENR